VSVAVILDPSARVTVAAGSSGEYGVGRETNLRELTAEELAPLSMMVREVGRISMSAEENLPDAIGGRE
jgi:hypothetical protein